MTLQVTSQNNIIDYFKPYGAHHGYQAKRHLQKVGFERDISMPVMPVSSWGATPGASCPGLAGTVIESTFNKCMQNVLSNFGDRRTSQWTSSHGVNLMSYMPETAKKWGATEARYYNALKPATLLGITTNNLLKNESVTKTFFEKWKMAVSANYSGFFKNLKNGRLITAPGEAVPLTAKNYVRHSVLGEHTRKIADFLSGNGKPVSAALSLIAPVFMLWSTAKTMKQAYRQSSQNREGFLSRIFKTAMAGFKELSKQVASYHIGSIAFVFAAALVPVGGFAMITAGLAAAITAGILSNRLITKAIGPSVKENKPSSFYFHMNRV